MPGRRRTGRNSARSSITPTRSRSLPRNYKCHEFAYDPEIFHRAEIEEEEEGLECAAIISSDRTKARDRVESRVRELERYLASYQLPNSVPLLATPDTSPLASKCPSVHAQEDFEDCSTMVEETKFHIKRMATPPMDEQVPCNHANNALASLIALYTQDQPVIYSKPPARGLKRSYEYISNFLDPEPNPMTKGHMLANLAYDLNASLSGTFSPPLAPKWDCIPSR